LAIGGGSVIDSAKAISFGVPYDGDVWDFFTKKATVKKTLATGSILTISGTGSETSSSCVVTNEETLVKGGVGGDFNRPKFTIMNPELTMSLPPYQTACGAYDALTHVMERYFSNVPSAIVDLQCESLMRGILNIAPLLLTEPRNYDYRAEIMWASKIAHDNTLGVGRVFDYSAHVLGQQIGAMCDLAHGATLAITLPAWMKYIYKQHVDRFYQLAINVFRVEPGAMSKELTAYEGITRMEAFIKRMGLPTKLSEANIDASMTKQVTGAFEGKTLGAYHPLNKSDIDNIFELAK
jgi:alcohol dehydrogenase YqhD (iron-dependent ADH family)